jgi:hypothetical protein
MTFQCCHLQWPMPATNITSMSDQQQPQPQGLPLLSAGLYPPRLATRQATVLNPPNKPR